MQGIEWSTDGLGKRHSATGELCLVWFVYTASVHTGISVAGTVVRFAPLCGRQSTVSEALASSSTCPVLTVLSSLTNQTRSPINGNRMDRERDDRKADGTMVILKELPVADSVIDLMNFRTAEFRDCRSLR